MSNNSFFADRFYVFDCCFVCHKPLMFPLHAAQQRHLGMMRIHKQCYSEELFEQFERSHIVTVGPSDQLDERCQPRRMEWREQRSQQIFGLGVADGDE